MSHLIGDRPRQPVIVQCESVSLQGNRCEMQSSHRGCHEAPKFEARWFDFVPETPGELPLRRVVVAHAAIGDAGAEGHVPPLAQPEDVYAHTDAEVLEVLRLDLVRTTVYVVKHDGKLREVCP